MEVTVLEAVVRFHRGVFALPWVVQAWMAVLMTANLVLPLFLLDRIEARVVLAVFLVSAGLMVVLTTWTGFTRLLGLGHAPWIPMLVYLWPRLAALPADELAGVWLRLVILVDGVSLLLDATDVARYVFGNRDEIVDLAGAPSPPAG